MIPMIQLENLTKIFETPKGPVVAAGHITMAVAEGETCILLGPPGCGKSTILKMINRIVPPTTGKVYLDGKDTTAWDTVQLRRRIGYVIQQVGLFPNMTVEENIGVAPRLLGWRKDKVRKRAAELVEMLALNPKVFLKRYPKALSGDQALRIGMARALAADPLVVLMDEPFGALDPIDREAVQDEFLKIRERLGKTILLVSNDIDEAVKMGHKIAMFRSGKLEQLASPDTLLAHPANAFIADFVGGDRTLKRLRLVKVREAMNPNPPRVRAEDSLERAAGLMEEHGLENIIMVGPRGRARGVVYLSVAREKQGSCGDNRSGLKAMARLDDDLRTAVSLMFTYDLTWLPVVDGDGFYKGYLTQSGITHLLGETYREQIQTPARI